MLQVQDVSGEEQQEKVKPPRPKGRRLRGAGRLTIFFLFS